MKVGDEFGEGLKVWDEFGEGLKSRDEYDEGLKDKDERFKCWDESERLKCWDDSIMPSKNGNGSEGLRNWDESKGKCRDKIDEMRFGVEDVGKQINSQNSCRDDKNSDDQSNHTKGTLKGTVADRLRRYVLALQDEDSSSNEQNQRISQHYDKAYDSRKGFTKFVDTVDGTTKSNDNKTRKEPKMSAYFVKDNVRKTVNLEEKIGKNNEFIKTKKMKTDLNIDDCQSIDVVRVTETFKLRLNRNSEQLTGIADVYTNFKNDPLNFDTDTLENEMDEIYQSVFGEKETDIKNNVIRQEDVDLSDSASVEDSNENYSASEDQRVSNSSYTATTNSILSENISNDCSQKRSLHLNYLMTRLKNIKLQNENNLTSINRKETENKIHLESETSQGSRIHSQTDSKSSIHKILLYDSKVRSNKLNLPRRFPTTNNPNENNSTSSNIHLLPNFSTPQSFKFPQESSTQLDSKFNQESILKSDSKSQESNSKLQESSCNTSKDESQTNARSKLLMKKLQMLKNIKDVT